MTALQSMALAIILTAVGTGLGVLGGMEWSDRACETTESKRIADAKSANEQSAINGMALIGELYEDLKRQAPAVAGYQRDILFVCSGLPSVRALGTSDDLSLPHGAGGAEREITTAERAEFAAAVAADIGNCADAIPKRNAASDYIVKNGG